MIDVSRPAETRSAALLIRTWTEPTMPQARRARLLTVNADSEPDTWSTAVGDAAIAQEVLRWLRSSGGDAAPVVDPPADDDAPVAPRGPAGPPVPPLVDTDWAQAHLTDPDVVLVEVGDGAVPAGGRHLPGAVRVDWVSDLQHPTRRTLLDAVAFAALMDSRGITTASHVVLCGDSRAYIAAAAYWTLTHHGHQRVSLLDGGQERWLAEGRPVVGPDAPGRPATAGYHPGPRREDIVLRRDLLLAGLVGAPPGTRLVDCRSTGEFAGRPALPYDAPTDRHRVTGHIPGAVSLPVEELLEPGTQRLRALPALRALCRARELTPDDQVIVYCGVGDRSVLVWFVLHELLGWPDVRCYAGGWAEYGSLTDVPVEPGT